MNNSTFKDLNLIRHKNQMNVFSLLREGEKTCNELTKFLKISNVAIYNVIDDLLCKGIIKKQSNQLSAVGRKPAVYSLNDRFGLFAAVDFSQKYISLDLFDIYGNAVAHENANNAAHLDINDVYNVVEILQKMTARYCTESTPLCSICIATPGRINKETGYFWIAARFGNPTEINMEQIFHDAFHCHVIVKNDMNLASIGINNHPGLAGISNALLLHIGNDCGAALFLNGKNYEGENNAACEFGSTLLFNRQPIHTSFSIKHMLDQYRSATGETVTFEEFAKLYASDQPIVQAIVEEYISTLSVAINNILVILDISTVIFNGEVRLFGEKFLNQLQNDYLKAKHFFVQPRCLFSPLGSSAILQGCKETAITSGIKHILEQK